MANSSEDKLDPRVKRTRKLLMQAFFELLADQNLQAVTVQDITSRAEVNRATFYAHFQDKYDLFDYAIRETFFEVLQSKLPDAEVFSTENLRQLIIAVCEYLMHIDGSCHPTEDQIRLLIAKQIQTQLNVLLLQWIEAAEQDIPPPQVAASVMSWAIFGAGAEWSQNRALAPSLEVYADHICEMLAGQEVA